MSENLAVSQASKEDPELQAIVPEEEKCLSRVLSHLREAPKPQNARRLIDYDRQLIDLRDQIAQARLEDVPPLLEQMERLQNLAARQGQSTTGHVDARSPYFGRMVLEEQGRRREILIGRSTYIDTRAGVRIVDWRDAPVSRLYYRYNEGDTYEETFGEREVEGEVLTRRSVTIVDSKLRRIVSPQGIFVRQRDGAWMRGATSLRLHGGQGTALRAEQHHRPGKLGVGLDDATEDRHLKAITALIDPRQFELISKPDSGLVVIQGGAGSGKTTIGLHRLAYLAFQDRRRFRPDKMLVIAFNQALVRYISQVLPALDVTGVGVRTYGEWAARLRASHFPELTRKVSDDTPSAVTRLKKHPLMLHAIDEHVAEIGRGVEERILQALAEEPELSRAAAAHWAEGAARPLAHRLHALSSWLGERGVSGKALNMSQREVRRGLQLAEDVIGAWSELMTDKTALTRAVERYAPGQFAAREISQVHEWCTAQIGVAIAEIEQARELREAREADRAAGTEAKPARRARSDRDDGGEREADGAAHREQEVKAADDPSDPVEPPVEAVLDAEDDTLLLRFSQRLRGPLLKPGGAEALSYEHLLIDEAQDLSPVELAVLMQTVSRGQSVTLAGDVAQRLYMDNGFSGWEDLLRELGLSHVQVEPLQITYRSTEQVMEFARAVLGPLATGEPPRATRAGAEVELFGFAHTGDAVGFLSEALRELSTDEPQASIAVVARYPEQADLFHAGLRQAEIPNLRRIAAQDFPFRPGVDVTDLKQVKGLEFDYVVLVEVNQSTYPRDDESRHLLHIGATRAAHQLWLLATGKPSELIPETLRQREE